jgi:hypothetical protein
MAISAGVVALNLRQSTLERAILGKSTSILERR